jgi:DNA repair exonuclease SbcCD nuclease subunit
MSYDFLIVGDLQLTGRQPICRTDDFTAVQYHKFREILLTAAIHKVKAILQPGDFWDYAAPGYGLYSLYAEELRGFKKKFPIEVFVVRGQHDLFFHSLSNIDNTALKALEIEGLVTVLGEKARTLRSHSGEVMRLYGSSWGESIPTIRRSPRARRSGVKSINVLVTHESIAPKRAAKGGYQPLSSDKFLKDCQKKNYHLVVVGDYHAPFSSSNKNILMVNVGCMVRLKADENHIPRIGLWSADKPVDLKWVELKHQDSDKVISREHIGVKSDQLEIVKEFLEVLQQDEQIEAQKGFIEIVKGLLKKDKDIVRDKLSEGAISIIKEGIDLCARKEEGKTR